MAHQDLLHRLLSNVGPMWEVVLRPYMGIDFGLLSKLERGDALGEQDVRVVEHALAMYLGDSSRGPKQEEEDDSFDDEYDPPVPGL